MTNTFTFSLPLGCDPGVLHKLLKTNGFIFLKNTEGVEVGGISYDDGSKIATITLDPSETKNPTTIVNSYVYVPYVPPNYPLLYTNAQTTVTAALTTYNTAVSGYTGSHSDLATAKTAFATARTAYNTAGLPVTSGNAVAHIKPLSDMADAISLAMLAVDGQDTAFASAFPAIKASITALVDVITVLAKRVAIIEEN
jgi:hypothetical protein